MLDLIRRETRLFPGLTEAQIHADQSVREDLGEEVIDITKLGLDVGLLLIKFAGTPETLEGDLDLITNRPLFGDGPHAIFATDEELINLAVNLEDRRALGFGRVCGQHRLNADAIKALGDLLVAETRITQAIQRPTPRARVGS